jgi:hypothetical protein
VTKWVDRHGQSIVSCKLNCEGIRNEPEKGIVPRCFYSEIKKEPDCIIVGINPGISNEREREHYKKSYKDNKRVKYDDVKEFFEKNLKKLKYFKSLRRFAEEIGFGRSILWTELCKCENKRKGKKPPLQTFRTCMKKFFQKELKKFPKAPIITAGDQTFQALCYMFPDRFIVGVPHPKGSYATFDRLFKKGKLKLKTKYKKMAKRTKDKQDNPNCVRIFPS